MLQDMRGGQYMTALGYEDGEDMTASGYEPLNGTVQVQVP